MGPEAKCMGLASEFREVTSELCCYFFDAGEVTTASKSMGFFSVDQHQILGKALADVGYNFLKDNI